MYMYVDLHILVLSTVLVWQYTLMPNIYISNSKCKYGDLVRDSATVTIQYYCDHSHFVMSKLFRRVLAYFADHFTTITALRLGECCLCLHAFMSHVVVC